MKRLICLVMTLMLACSGALAEAFDQEGLEQLEGCTVSMDLLEVNTIVRPDDQPWTGECALPDSWLDVYLDFIRMPDEEATFMRLTLSVTSFEYVAAEKVSILVNGKEYVFTVEEEVSEYDGMYFEDFTACMTDESLPMIKAMARSKTDVFPVTLSGGLEVQGSITLPLDRVAELYDAYIRLGGAKQDLEQFRQLWPVVILER